MNNHPWLEKYPISKDSKYLIIGTHPPMPYCGKLEFYYGNMNEFWRFLDKVYPDNKLYLNGCPKVEDIISFLDNSKISITDIVYKTNIDKFSTDKAMGKVNKEDLNPFLLDWLINSKVETIYFTSFSGTNSAKNLFKKWYKFKFQQESKKNKITVSHFNEIELCDRKIKLIDLFSPSPTARKSSTQIKEYQEWKTNNNPNDYDSFRIHWYKTYLPKLTK
jgi:G:T/U-mismatch repair DNA glycosylase